MTDTDILKYAVQRELELTKKRSVALARQNWEVVIELEAKLDELALLRKKLANDAVKQINSGNPGV